MNMDFRVLAAANQFTEETIIGEGAIKGKDGKDGKNSKIKSIDRTDKQTIVTFEWTEDDETVKTEQMIINDGADGADGINGENAYQEAVRLGYVGTEEEWLASLKGNTGERGEKGVGIESITKQGTVGLIDTYLIVYSDGTTSTYEVTNGANVTKNSQLENDSQFITNATIGLINYYLKDEVYSKAKIDELLRNVGAGLSVKIVLTLPTEEISGTTIYLINTAGSNYNQYMYIDGDWASLGSTSVDLSSYYNKTQIDTMLLGYITASTLLTQLMQYTKTSDLAKVALSNDYNDLDNLPEIPDVSGIKPYVNVLQDSENTAPTSKVVYDAVQTINEEVEKKADSEELEDYAKKIDIPTDYLTEDDLEPYAKTEQLDDYALIDDVEEMVGDLGELKTAVNEVKDSLVDINDNLGEKADKTEVKEIYDNGFASRNLAHDIVYESVSGWNSPVMTTSTLVLKKDVDYILSVDTPNTNAEIYFYDYDKTKQKLVTRRTNGTRISIPITPTEDLSLTRILSNRSTSTETGLLSNLQIEYGTEATPYTEYAKSNAELTDNVNEIAYKGNLGNLYNKYNVRHGGYYNVNTNPISWMTSSRHFAPNYIEVKPNTNYILKATVEARIIYISKEKEFISSDVLTKGVFHTPANCYYILANFDNADYETIRIDLATNENDRPYIETNAELSEIVWKDSVVARINDFVEPKSNEEILGLSNGIYSINMGSSSTTLFPSNWGTLIVLKSGYVYGSMIFIASTGKFYFRNINAGAWREASWIALN